MVVTLKKLRVRYVKVPLKRAKVVRQTVLELQAESILRTHRRENGVSGNNTNGYGKQLSEDNGRN